MENKESYTPEEVEEMLNAIRDYSIAHTMYQYTQSGSRIRVNEHVINCNKKIPKSLIDKFKISEE